MLIATLLAVAVLYAAGAYRTALRDPIPRSRAISFFAGWAITATTLISPLCALSVALFSARVGQHMVLALAGAPLVAAGHPLHTISAAWLPASRRPIVATEGHRPLSATLCFAILLWFWHAPGPYAATFASPAAYWAMHLTLYGSALWLWSSFLDRTPGMVFPIIGAGVVASVQMGLLGALLTFAPRPLFAAHLLTAPQWGFTALSDQQLGGAIMWVPGCIAFLTVAMLVFRRVLTEGHFAGGSCREARAR